MLKSLNKNPLVRYVREAYVELQKVVWPNSETTKKHTYLVIGISLFIAFYFGVLDYLLNIALEALL